VTEVEPNETFEDELRALCMQAARELSVEQRRALRDRFGQIVDDVLGEVVEVEAGDAEEEPLPGRFGIIGNSPAMQKIFARLEKMVRSDYPVLVTGESGTGKELIARALHQYGPRKRRRFLSENCAAIPETLLESILFGHTKGAFTGATRDNPGHFVAADKGTLFLDEVGDMPLVMQGKLLRVLQDGEVRAVGSEKVRKVDVRLVAATNRDLRRMANEKTFREDLYFRLNVLEIHLPPLRERDEDVLLIAEYLLRQARAELGRKIRLSEGAKKALVGFEWPGNVRQLENELKRAAALGTGEVLEARDFSFGS